VATNFLSEIQRFRHKPAGFPQEFDKKPENIDNTIFMHLLNSCISFALGRDISLRFGFHFVSNEHTDKHLRLEI
jgi:hypothetical protein